MRLRLSGLQSIQHRLAEAAATQPEVEVVGPEDRQGVTLRHLSRTTDLASLRYNLRVGLNEFGWAQRWGPDRARAMLAVAAGGRGRRAARSGPTRPNEVRDGGPEEHGLEPDNAMATADRRAESSQRTSRRLVIAAGSLTSRRPSPLSSRSRTSMSTLSPTSSAFEA